MANTASPKFGSLLASNANRLLCCVVVPEQRVAPDWVHLARWYSSSEKASLVAFYSTLESGKVNSKDWGIGGCDGAT